MSEFQASRLPRCRILQEDGIFCRHRREPSRNMAKSGPVREKLWYGAARWSRSAGRCGTKLDHCPLCGLLLDANEGPGVWWLASCSRQTVLRPSLSGRLPLLRGTQICRKVSSRSSLSRSPALRWALGRLSRKCRLTSRGPSALSPGSYGVGLISRASWGTLAPARSRGASRKVD